MKVEYMIDPGAIDTNRAVIYAFIYSSRCWYRVLAWSIIGQGTKLKGDGDQLVKQRGYHKTINGLRRYSYNSRVYGDYLGLLHIIHRIIKVAMCFWYETGNT